MYYIVYKTTNVVNGMIYIGVHRTSNINDGYLGSGILFKKALEKYGRENFERETLQICESAEEMFETESKIVTQDFVRRTDTYNVKEGGTGIIKPREIEYYYSGQHTDNAIAALKEANKRNLEAKQKRVDEYNNNPTRCKTCSSALPYVKKRNSFCSRSCAATFNNTGRHISDAHRKKTSRALLSERGLKRQQSKERRKQERERRKEIIKQADFSKRGWVTDVANKFGIESNGIKRWMKIHMPEEYKQAYE